MRSKSDVKGDQSTALNKNQKNTEEKIKNKEPL